VVPKVGRYEPVGRCRLPFAAIYFQDPSRNFLPENDFLLMAATTAVRERPDLVYKLVLPGINEERHLYEQIGFVVSRF